MLNDDSVSLIILMFVLFQLYSLIGFMFTEDSSPAFALFKFVQVRWQKVSVYISVGSCTHTHMHECMHARMHTRMLTCTHTYTHTHMHAHTVTHSLSLRKSFTQRIAEGYEGRDCELRGQYPVCKKMLPASGRNFALSWTDKFPKGPIWQQGYW